MKTIKLRFESNGKTVNKTAIVTDDLTSLSNSKRNQATDIIEYYEDGFWSIIFDEDENLQYEVEFVIEDYQKTLNPIKAITWFDDVIYDCQNVKIF